MARMSQNVARLSCEQCRQRKTKCDKGSPCSACKNAGISCTAVQRPRLPRGRNAKAKNRNNVLDTRVAHLEALVQQLEAQVQNSSDDSQTSSPYNGSNLITSPRADASSPNKTDKFVAKDFWTALSAEVAGLRDSLEESDDGESPQETSDANRNHQTNLALANSSESVLFGHNAYLADNDLLEAPSKQMRTLLLYLYHQRVDGLFKAIHWPTVVAEIESQYDGAENKTSSPSIEALEFAIYFLAINSITDEESTSLLLMDREPLLHRFRLATETLISRANLLTSPDLTVLQAFVIYLLCFRNSWQYVWTLLATAVRVATALGLPSRDENVESSLDLEKHRRLWYCIGTLDSQTSFNRGFKPLIPFEDLGAPPLIVNDSELSLGAASINSTPSFNDMSFFFVTQQGTICSRALCIPAVETESPWGDWESKVRAVRTCEESINQRCAGFDNSAHPFARLIHLIAQDIIVNMHLLLRRPPWRSKNNAVPPWDDYDLLKATSDTLERASTEYEASAFSPWAWYGNGRVWIKWYALAILLAELCTPRMDAVADKGYAVAQATFTKYAQIVADDDSGMLWKPIEKLMSHVHRIRGATSRPAASLLAQAPMSPIASSSTYGASTSAAFSQNMPAEVATTAKIDISMGDQLTDQMVDIAPELNDGFDFDNIMSWQNWDNFLNEVGPDGMRQF